MLVLDLSGRPLHSRRVAMLSQLGIPRSYAVSGTRTWLLWLLVE